MTNCFLKMPLNSFLGVEYLLWKLFCVLLKAVAQIMPKLKLRFQKVFISPDFKRRRMHQKMRVHNSFPISA